MTERPILFADPMVRALIAGTKTQTRRVVKFKPWHQIEERDDGSPWPWMYDDDTAADYWLPCPYGQPGERLWVREAFCDARSAMHGRVLYRASGDVACGWKPCIHMPRDASRIVLEVTAVRVERLQDISEADALAEGAFVWPECPEPAAINLFRAIWDQINGTESWDSNPWVWVVEFKRVTP